MAYNTEDLILTAVKEIESKRLFFIEDIISILPCSKPTFYEHFPIESDELNYLKGKLDHNKIIQKVSIRYKLQEGNNTASLLALYKLICSEEERRRLSQTNLDIKSDGEAIGIDVKFIKRGETGKT